MRKLSYILLSSFLLLVNSTIEAQYFTVKTDRNRILIGQQITLALRADKTEKSNHIIFLWPDSLEKLSHFEIVNKGEIDSSFLAGITYYKQFVTLTSFDSGTWLIPVFSITLKTDHDTTLRSLSIPIEVFPANVSGQKGYHDITSMLPVRSARLDWPVFQTSIVSVILLLMLLGLFFYKKYSGTTENIRSNQLAKGAVQTALNALAVLETSQYDTAESIKIFHHQLNQIFRSFWESFSGEKSLHYTSSELENIFLQDKIDPVLAKDFIGLLIQGDNIRFAKNKRSEDHKLIIQNAKKIMASFSISIKN